MSLILDALRKSEAERRRGQAPDLYAELPPVTRHSRGLAQPWWWVAGALALVALLVLAVLQRSPAPMPNGNAPASSTVDPQRSGDEGRVADRQDNPPASTTGVPVAVVGAPPLTNQGEVVVAPADTLVPPPSQERTSVPEPALAATRAAANAAPPSAARPPATLPSATPPSATSAPVPATARVQPLPPPAVPLPAPPVPAMPVSDANAPIALSDLGAAERQQLPPLKVSMHLWNSIPAERFAIIDGARVGEGDRVGDAFVESITRDGLVLVWNGRRLRLGIR